MPKVQKKSETERKAAKTATTRENDAEDMFVIMEHFRMMVTADADMPAVESEGMDLLILMGNYLRTVDV